jgi:hypothetical protein
VQPAPIGQDRLATLLGFRRLFQGSPLGWPGRRFDLEHTDAGRVRELGPGHEDTYREYVEAAASAERCEVFLNRYVAHAAIIVEYLFRNAQFSVEILTGRLNPAIYGDHSTVRAAIDFLDRTANLDNSTGHKLCILTEEGVDQNTHPLFIRARDSHFAKLIELRRVPDTVKHTFNFHFALADNMHYRCKEPRGI